MPTERRASGECLFLLNEKENRLKEIYTTEQAKPDLYPFDRGKPVLPKVSELRRKLAEKAKREPKFRFYALYDRIYRKDVLLSAWRIVRRNDGGAGIDQQTIDDIEQYGIDRLIDEIQEALKSKTYQPQPIKRVHVPKGEGNMRPLGIPTVKDRIIQQACLLILEPIFEEDFLDCSYGYRPGRSAHQALNEIELNLKAGRTAVYDADLKGYFDSIPHDKLMKAVEYRIADRQVLRLIRMWLTAPIIAKDEQGQTTKKRPDCGTPQGGVISPLLANLYLHWFDKVFHSKCGPFKFANARMIRFADDFVIMARYVDERIIQWVEAKIEEWMGLAINRDKTKVINATDSGTTLDFLGYSFRYDKHLVSGWHGRYWNRYPSKKSIKRFQAKVHELTSSSKGCKPIGEVIKQLNRYLVGWSNYFDTGYPSKTFRSLNVHVFRRMWQLLQRKSQRPFKPPEGMSWYKLIFEKLKVHRLKAKTRVQAVK
jgi:RNA-directed DNA polymerase